MKDGPRFQILVKDKSSGFDGTEMRWRFVAHGAPYTKAEYDAMVKDDGHKRDWVALPI